MRRGFPAEANEEGERAMHSIPFMEEEASGFEQGCRFTLIALHMVGVDLKSADLTALLDEVVKGERTLLPSPPEVKTTVRGGNLGMDEAASLSKMASAQRKQWDELHRKYAALMLKVARNLK
jgi:hypothetical protein